MTLKQAEYRQLIWNPQSPRKRTTAKISAEEWEQLKEFIEFQYVKCNKPCNEVLGALASERNYFPSDRQLRYQLGKWNIEKYIKHDRQAASLPENEPSSEPAVWDADELEVSVDYPGAQENFRAEKRRGSPLDLANILTPIDQPENKRRKLTVLPYKEHNLDLGTSIAKEPSQTEAADDGDHQMGVGQDHLFENINSLTLKTFDANIITETGIEKGEVNHSKCLETEPLTAFPGISNSEQIMPSICSPSIEVTNVEQNLEEAATSGAKGSEAIEFGTNSKKSLSSLNQLWQDVLSSENTSNVDVIIEKITEYFPRERPSGEQSFGTSESHQSTVSTDLCYNLQTIHTTKQQVKLCKRAADFLYFGGRFEQAFTYYRACYFHERRKWLSTSPVWKPNDTLVRLFTEVAKSAKFPRAEAWMRQYCKRAHWSEILDKGPWSLNSTALFLLLADRQFHECAEVYSVRLNHELELYRSVNWVSGLPEGWYAAGGSRFALGYINATRRSFNEPVRQGYYPRCTEAILLLILRHSAEVTTILCHVHVILKHFCNIMESPKTIHWLSGVPSKLWHKANHPADWQNERYVLYCVLSRAYEDMASADKSQELDMEFLADARDAFAALESNHDMNPYAVIRSIAWTATQQGPCYHNLETDVSPSDEDAQATYLARMSLFLSNLGGLCHAAIRFPNTKGQEYVSQFIICLLSIPKIEPISTQDAKLRRMLAKFTPKQDLRRDILDLCYLDDENLQNGDYETFRPQDPTLFSSRASQISGFSSFKKTRRPWFDRSITPYDANTSPTAGLNRSSLGIDSLRSSFWTSSLGSYDSRSSTIGSMESISSLLFEQMRDKFVF